MRLKWRIAFLSFTVHFFITSQMQASVIATNTTNSFSAFKLEEGDSITGAENLQLHMQNDGNLVLRQNGKALWSSGTNGKGCARSVCSMAFQRDGNLVIRKSTDPIWFTWTSSNPEAELVLSASEPHLKIVTKHGKTVWASNNEIQNLCPWNKVRAPLYVVAGQSNALGAGRISDSAGAGIWSFWKANGYDFRFWSIGNGSRNDSSWMPGDSIAGQLQAGDATFGPELSLAEKLQRNGVKNFYIFKAAWGASSLSKAQGSNSWLHRGEGGHYDRMRAGLKKAALQLCSNGLRPMVNGFFWMQGESDSKSPWVEAYESNLKKLVDEVSVDILSPSANFVVAKVKRHADFWDKMRSAQDSISGYRGKVAVIETNDLQSYSGACSNTNYCYIHFNASGLIKMGSRAYTAMTSPVTESSGVSPLPVAESQTSSTSTAQPSDCISKGDDEDLNKILKEGGKNKSLILCPGATFRLKAPIVFTAERQKIFTKGLPDGASRATLIVTGPTQTTAIFGRCGKCDGVELRNIIINGNRPALGQIRGGEALIQMGGKVKDQIIDNIKSFEPRGWSAMHLAAGQNFECRNLSVTNNEIGPSGNSAYMQWADGISLGCRESRVANNIITDATDGGIVVFGAAGSTIENNTVRTLNRILLGGINVVDYDPAHGNYNNTVIRNNKIEAKGALIKVGLGVGPAIWFGGNMANPIIHGGAILNNVLSGNFMGYGIAVNGVENFTIKGNTDTAKHIGSTSGCGAITPPAAFLMNKARSKGDFQNFSPASLNNIICIH